MRILLPLLAAIVLALPVQAQTADTATSAHKHLKMEQRFGQANITNDGHLTLAQAKTGYRAVARHFAAMDQDKKGYVTQDDIRAYYKMQRALHHQSASTHRGEPSS